MTILPGSAIIIGSVKIMILSEYLNFLGVYYSLSKYTPVQGKTYSLFAEGVDSEGYYAEIKRLANVFLQRCPDEKRLLAMIQKEGKRSLLLGSKITGADRKILQFVKETLRQSLCIYTKNVSNHLKSLPFAKRMDSTLATKEGKYHLYMLEIELVNRIYREEFNALNTSSPSSPIASATSGRGAARKKVNSRLCAGVAPRTASFT